MRPEFVTNDSDDACTLSTAYGFTPDDWQSDVMSTWLGRDKYGRWASSSCGLLVPRQNGKNGCYDIRELFGLTVLGEKILHTAHQQKTATKAFKNLADAFKHPDLAKLLDGDPKTALGREGIYLKNGGSIEYIARTRSSGRGFTVDLLVCDEAQEMDDDQMEALKSTNSAAPSGNPQTIFGGTPPGTRSPAEVFGRLRNEAISLSNSRLSWMEWSVEEIGDITDKSRWFATNPALGKRISIGAVEDELSLFSPDGFARERLGWWPKQSVASAIEESAWSALKTSSPPTEGKKAYGIKFAPDGSVVALAVALKPREGKPHVEVIDHRSMSSGNRWLVDWLTDRWKEASVIVIDGKSGAENLVNALNANKVASKVICLPKVGDVITACTTLLNDINEMSFTHFDQPALNMAATNARKRPIGDRGGWGWGGINDVDVTPLEAVSLALWGVKTSKRDPTRKQKVAF